MSDKERVVANCIIYVNRHPYGNNVSLNSAEPYVYGCDMTWDEWEQIKSAVDRLIAEIKAEGGNQ